MRILKVFGLTIAYFLLFEVLHLMIFVPYWLEYYEDNAIRVASVTSALLTLLIIYFFVRPSKTSESRLFEGTKSWWYYTAALSGVAFVFLQTPINWVYNFVAESEFNITYDFTGLDSVRWNHIVRSVIVVPVFEELFFRRYVQHQLHEKYRPLLAIGVASILFALIHLPYGELYYEDAVFSPHQAVMALFGGIISGTMYWKSGSVGPSVVFHMMWNLAAHLT